MNINLKSKEGSVKKDSQTNLQFKNFSNTKKTFNFGKFKKDNTSTNDEQKSNEDKGTKVVKNFI